MTIGHIMVDLDGFELTQVEKELLLHPQIGGVILFSRNFESKSQLRSLVQAIRRCRSELLISVDQEGGRVQRFRQDFTRLPAFAEYGRLYDQNPQAALDEAEKMAYTMAMELSSVGIDFSFTPVLDIDVGLSTVIGDRSFHHTASVVIELARAFINGMHRAGMPATGKHFPGHGAVALDSHLTLPIDDRDFSQIETKDLQPFIHLPLILDAVMPAHVLYNKVDKTPACFSSYWLQEILRKKIKFNGVIFSDDLSMLGAKVIGNFVQRAETALQAGCDMILVCHHRGEVIKMLDELQNYTNLESRQRLLNFKKKCLN